MVPEPDLELNRRSGLIRYHGQNEPGPTTVFTSCVQLKLSEGVHVDGYVVFNGGTAAIEPRVDQGAIPIRFSDKF